MTASTTTQDLTTMTPQAFDEALAAIYTTHAKNLSRLDSAMGSLHRAAGDRRQGYGRRAHWGLSDNEAEARAEERADDDSTMLHIRKDAERALETLQQAREAVAATTAQIEERDDVFRARGGWSRFFLVENTNGHIHSSMHCSTCRPTTQFSWLPTVSGKTEKEAVSEHGPMLCTVCFPSAPLEWTNYWEKEEERKQAESCPGSGTFDWVEGTTRFGYAAGNGGTCSHCNGYAAATSSRKIRKHKPGK